MLPALFKFGDFELDCPRYELRRKGHPLKLEKIPMELLLFLAESNGRLVSREEIEKRLWGKEVFVDAEHGINTAIRKIRQVLGDDSEHPRFVQTVQRKGYRFIAEVTRIEEIQNQTDGAANGGAPLTFRVTERGPMNPSQPGTEVAKKGAYPARHTSRRLVWMGTAAVLLLGWPVYKFVLPRFERHGTEPVAIRSL